MTGKNHNKIKIALAIIGIIIHDIMFGIVAYGAYSYCTDNERDIRQTNVIYSDVWARAIDPRITVNGPMYIDRTETYKENPEFHCEAIYIDEDGTWIHEDISNEIRCTSPMYPYVWENNILDACERHESADHIIINMELPNNH